MSLGNQQHLKLFEKITNQWMDSVNSKFLGVLLFIVVLRTI